MAKTPGSIGSIPTKIITSSLKSLVLTAPTSELPKPTPASPSVDQALNRATSSAVPQRSTTSPSGPVVHIGPCCPGVATFEGSTRGRNTYFGFDDKTNLVAKKKADEYWVPPTKAKTLPSNKQKRDGARWVSVGVGLEAQVEINFGGKFTKSCLRNCTYKIEPQTVAKVTSSAPTATGVAFKIKGKAAGEASLKVICGGKVKGYFHIWCANMATIKIDVAGIRTTKAVKSSYNASSLKTVLNRVFRQALINFSLRDLGQIDLSSNLTIKAYERSNVKSGKIEMSSKLLRTIHNAADVELVKRAKKPGAPLPRQNAYRLYFYVAPAQGKVVGAALSLGQSPAFVFYNTKGSSENTAAHEIGHSLGLAHPKDNIKKDQFARHNLATLNHTIRAISKTHTEPAVPAGKKSPNIMANDPLNLMGYWENKKVREPLRYHQWKACKRR